MPRPGMAKCEVTPHILGPAGSSGPLRGGTICFAKTLEKGPGGGSPFVLLYFLLLTLCYGGC